MRTFITPCVLLIGPPDEEGADLFYVDVTTPQALNEHSLEEAPQ